MKLLPCSFLRPEFLLTRQDGEDIGVDFGLSFPIVQRVVDGPASRAGVKVGWKVRAVAHIPVMNSGRT